MSPLESGLDIQSRIRIPTTIAAATRIRITAITDRQSTLDRPSIGTMVTAFITGITGTIAIGNSHGTDFS